MNQLQLKSERTK